MATTPGHPWTAPDLAAQLGLDHHTLLAQLAHWTTTGYLTRTSRGTYALNTPP
jgi:DNA-binding IclR family transcriptional regulator